MEYAIIEEYCRKKNLMKTLGENNRRCFTFIWTLENICYCWQKRGESIVSPNFVINELQESKYRLKLYPRGLFDENYIICFLGRTGNSPGVGIDCEFALLSKEGSVLTSRANKGENEFSCTGNFEKVREVFDIKRSVYLPDDKLTVRCRIWKNEGELTKNVQCFARSRISIEKNSFLWKIRNFSYLQSEEKRTYQIKSMLDNKLLLTFDLLSKNTFTDEDLMTIQLVAENDEIKRLVYSVTLSNVFGSANKRIRKEFLFCENKPKLSILPFSKNDLIANKNTWLPNDVLILRCDCIFSTGKILEEIESINYDCDRFQVGDLDNPCLDEKNTVSASKRVLNENLKSLFHDNILSDIKLQTNTKTHFAHKSYLSARSPVFKAMFENNMKEKLNECVDIQDLDSDTVYRMLQYVYTAEIQDLQYENACNLYRAADKYEILALRDECSAVLKSNLCTKNACEVLILADLHLDEELKAATQDFIFNHDVVNSEEWKQLMKSHVKLATDTMYLQIQRITRKFSHSKLSPVTPKFGSNSAEKPVASPKNCSDSEKTMTASSGLNISNRSIPSVPPGFSSNVEKKPHEPPFHLSVSSGTTKSTSPGFNKSMPEKTFLTPISFGNSSEKKVCKPSFGLENSSANIPSKSSFSPTNTCEKKLVETSFSFGKSNEKISAEPSFSFGSSSVKPPVEPPIPFGSSSEKTTVKSSFSFSSNSTNAPFKPFFRFGCNSSANKPSKTLFSFGSSIENTPAKPSFTFGNSSANTPVKTVFSFGSSSKNTPAAPSFSFGSKNEKTSVEPSFFFVTDREKKRIKQFFSFGHDGEKTSLSPEVNSSKEQTSSLNPGVGCSSFLNPCPSIESTSAEIHSTPTLLSISNANTSSLFVELKNTNADKPTVSSEIVASSLETSETTKISCNTNETSSVPFSSNDLNSVNVPSPPSELNSTKESTHIDSPASDSRPVETYISNAFDNITPKAESTSVLDITNEKLSASSGIDNFIEMTPPLKSVLDITCAVTASGTSGLDNTSRQTPSATPVLCSNSAVTESSKDYYDESGILSLFSRFDSSNVKSPPSHHSSIS